MMDYFESAKLQKMWYGVFTYLNVYLREKQNTTLQCKMLYYFVFVA